MRGRFRSVFVFGVLLPAAYGLGSACSLDLDESLIPASDAATGDVQSFGGTGGGVWTDATSGDGPKLDGSDAANDANGGNDASDAPTESGNPDGVDCDTSTCALNALCCYDSASGGACQDGPACSFHTIACDSTPDCPANQVCCLSDIGGTVSCETGCADLILQGAVQFCKVDNECVNGAVCGQLPPLVMNLVPPSYKTCQ